MPLDGLRVVALLPMKAHSERVPGKNFRPFHEKPLFRWILDSLLQLDSIDKVVINTDAREILAENGLVDSSRVIIRDRKPEICGDMVSMNKVLADDVNNIDADVYVMTHTTNPLFSVDTLRSALETFVNGWRDGQCDSLFTVNKIQTRFYRADASPVNHDPDNLVRTQDLEPWYEENSNLYIFTRESFGATNGRIGKRPYLFETPRLESIDIDDEMDWEFALLAADFQRGRKGM